MAPPADIHPHISLYFTIRIWGAPATLLSFVFVGVFIGLGKTKRVLLIQLVLNGVNALMDVLLVAYFDKGIQGVAIGTVIAQYLALVLAGFILAREYPWSSFFKSLPQSQWRSGLTQVLSQNRDLFIRTLFLIFGFSFFTYVGGQYGTLRRIGLGV